MALLSSVILALSLFGRNTHAWPQLPTDDGDFTSLTTLPAIPYTSTTQEGIDVAPRGLSLPAADKDAEAGMMMTMTLPVTSGPRMKKRRRTRSRRRKPPVSMRGLLPVDDDDDEVDVSGGAFVTLPVIHSTKRGVFSRQVEAKLANRSDVAYYAQLNIGTPPQAVYAQLDTGSFELWVNPDCTVLAAADQRFCEAVGFYDAARSSTAVSMRTSKTLRYGIGAANVSYVRDSLALAGSRSTMRQVQFGVATSSEDQFAGILGIGYGEGVNTRYKNLVDELAAQGVTRTRAFSLALGSKDEQEGAIVFGGVDPAKFSGALARLPILPPDRAPDGVARYWVTMNALSLTPPSRRTRVYPGSRMPVFLDSGATLTLLPEPLADMIAADFGSPAVDANGFYPVSCALVRLDGTLDFDFDGVKIRVPYREMIRELPTTPPACYLGIAPSSDFTLLGDTFLRSAYAVFDLETDAAYLAQYTNCGTRTMPINRPEDIAAIRGLCPDPAGAAAPSPVINGTTTPPASGSGLGFGLGSGPGAGSTLPTGPAPDMSGVPAAGTVSSPASSAAKPSVLAVLSTLVLAAMFL